MDVPIALLTLLVLALVVRFLSGPLRARSREQEQDLAAGQSPGEPPEQARAARQRNELQGLEAAREAKYREIRDCELDFRTGKLSREDYEAIDAQLRAEAIEILDRLERARGSAHEQSGDSRA